MFRLIVEYDNLRDYNGYSFDMHKLGQELYRVTKEGGIVGDAYWIVPRDSKNVEAIAAMTPTIQSSLIAHIK